MAALLSFFQFCVSFHINVRNLIFYVRIVHSHSLDATLLCVDVMTFVQPLAKFGGVVKKNHPVRLSVSYFNFKSNFSLTDELIPMKVYTVEIYDLRMCLKNYNPCLNHLKVDNQLWGTQVSFCTLSLTHSSSF